ncbi:MAG: hypothetical protein KJ606_02770 [Chloroflexi bacterium]|nr:hypothetical protein [Chloroflexota bacterium]
MFSVIFWCRVAWVAIVGALLVTTAAIPGTNNLLAFVVDIALLTLFAVANIKIGEYNRRVTSAEARAE